MKFKITQKEFLAGLYLAQGIVERKTTIPILGNVLIRSVSDGVMIAAADQAVTVRRRCEGTVEDAGALTASARKLYEMIREFPDGLVSVQALENNWIEASTEHSHFRLVGLDPREFPDMPEPPSGEEGNALRISCATLANMFERTVLAVSADETRANLNGVYVEGAGEGRIRMVATDGHRLAVIMRSVEGVNLQEHAIIPRKAILGLQKVLEEADDSVTLAIQEGVAHIECGPVQMSMRLVAGEFPDYTQVIPKELERKINLPLDEFYAGLKRISVVSSERTHGVKMELRSGELRMSSLNPDVGEVVEELEVEYDGAPVSIGFNARYFLDVLAVMDQEGRVELSVNDDSSPGLISQETDPDYRYIVMPMRL